MHSKVQKQCRKGKKTAKARFPKQLFVFFTLYFTRLKRCGKTPASFCGSENAWENPLVWSQATVGAEQSFRSRSLFLLREIERCVEPISEKF